ncbi:MAG: CRISPR-associated endonuclease Cas3'', partial [Dehalococcoidia bacterium]|nr:CRISPR-associated endonuclease Cas3'' [Dehalococcoidia bacterium]
VPGLILKDTPPGEGYDGDPNSVSQLSWVCLRDHTSHVCQEAERLLDAVPELRMPQEVSDAVVIAARYHDLGKSHDAFQRFLLSNLEGNELPEPEGAKWAKRGTKKRPSFDVRPPFFRHEVASALTLLYADISLDGWGKDLAAYLASAHHGKVRLSMRSLPKARDQSPDHYYLLGFRLLDETVAEEEWRQANLLPPTDLGGGVVTAQAVVDASIAQIGANDNGERSWLDRTLNLLAQLGPFRLAYLEALLRAADVLASIKEQEGGGDSNG